MILSGSEAMSQYFGYYVARTDARNVYEGASDAGPGTTPPSSARVPAAGTGGRP